MDLNSIELNTSRGPTLRTRLSALWAERPWNTRIAEEKMAASNPHLAEALRIEKMEGQRIATWARTVALAITAVLLVYVNPRVEVLYYEVLLLIFVLIGMAQLRVAKVGQSHLEMALIMADILLLTLTLTVPNPFAAEQWPTAFQFRFDGFVYFFIFLAGGSLAYSWRTVHSIGVAAALIWLAGVVAVMLFGTVDPELSDRVRSALVGYDRVFATLDPNSVEFHNRVQEAVVIVLVAYILGLKSQRMSKLLIRQAGLASERANLSRYFAPSMVEELAHRNQPMGGVRSQNVAVLFADIVGFTRFAEGRSPDDVIAMLRDFHAALEEEVFSHHGTLDKFMGDGLMASFGTPQTSPDDAGNAIAAAFAMQDRIVALNEGRIRRGLEPIRLSVGVHYGPVILGDVGNNRRMEFAMLGDTVNVASRLEAATRALSCRIVFSSAVMEAVSDQAMRDGYRSRMQFHQGLVLKGRSEAADVWTA
ncbi:adenylate/guanylate cyclase domain-containing protein [Rhizobium sp. TRM95796]|uniref:adenylate/guanylate cyclase domain-containing protein n=1 Tax=Rhizobium sp. TRM95796 TaxID=2979862 RepID=UPI0021E6F467|nr:adenylate/guanylate cyclase domain-containing protein [Rhizobium sp. TRM95796]MCV3765362.1 adenylate/guanylate cyclase domain-containing protein [Rhizobium sp. TRM95796]